MDMEDKSKLMEYLYGEMSETEKIAFEKEIKANPELLEELEELKSTLGIMKEYKEQEQTAPIFLLPERKQGLGMWWKGSLSIAAGLALLLLFGALLGIEIQTPNQTWKLSLSKSPDVIESGMELASLEDRLRALENQSKLNPQTIADVQTNDGISKESLERIIKHLQEAQTQQLQSSLHRVRQDQQEDLQKAIFTLFELLEERRQEDLILIAQSLQEVQENSEELFLQTDEMVGQLIVALNNKNSK
jgi:hypothetical protein